MQWSIVVPVKRLPLAKSRLFADGSIRADRHALVLALALDTVGAALAAGSVARVVVVTDDDDAIGPLAELGAHVVPDRPDAGLNPALRHGAGVAGDLAAADGVGVIASDLPALRPAELDSALVAATARRSFVTDLDGDGTALLAARAGVELDPHYGAASRQAHLASGAVELLGDWPSLRSDVDTPAALASALALGVGPATAALMACTSR